jgi:hypothetical protein
VNEVIDSASDRDDTGEYKGGSKQQGKVTNKAPYTPEYLGTGEDGPSRTNKGGSLASDKIENSIVVALTDLQEVLDRCLGNVPRTDSYANPRISMMIQRIHQNLADVCEKLENEE